MSFSQRTLTALAFASVVLAAPVADGPEVPAVVCNANTAPHQIRVAYGGPDAMAVSWNTNQKLAKPTVEYGEEELERSASSAISTTYPTSSTYNNHVTISKLKADTVYHYKPQCATQTYTFRTVRQAGKGEAMSFAMVGDMGTFGPDGLSLTGKVGVGAANPLTTTHTTIVSLNELAPTYDFVWHGMLAMSRS